MVQVNLMSIFVTVAHYHWITLSVPNFQNVLTVFDKGIIYYHHLIFNKKYLGNFKYQMASSTSTHHHLFNKENI